MIKNYLLVAVRNLWRNKVFSAINIIGLSVGIACCMLIFLYTKDEISFDRFHEKSGQLYRMTATMTSPEGTVRKIGSTGMMPGPAFKAQIPEIADFVRVQHAGFTVRVNNQVFDQEALNVDENFFQVFSFPLVEGNPVSALKDIHSVVLSEEIAKKYFGKRDAVGQVIELKTGDDFTPFIVSAIAKKTPQNSSIQIQMLLPMKFEQSRHDDNEWINFFLNTFIVLAPGANFQEVESKFEKIFQREAGPQLTIAKEKFGFKEQVKFQLQPLLDMHLSVDFPADNGLRNASNPVYSYLLTGIAFLILLIACINFINLTVARSLKRAKEIGIRKVVGGQRLQLIIQFLGESFILCFISFTMAIAFVQLLLPLFNTLANKALSFSYLLDTGLIIGYILLFVVTGLLAGFYPALVLSGFNPVQTLYGRQKFAGKNYLSKAMVVFQFTLASFLIIATIIIYSQFDYLTHFNLGYNDKNVAIVPVERIDKEKLSLFRSELIKHPAISSVTADQGGTWETIARINAGADIQFDFNYVDENYFPMLEIPIKTGRNFSTELATDTAEATIVNESFVKAAGWKDPIGQTIDFFYNNKKYTVIGVIKDYHHTSLMKKILPQVFITHPSYRYSDVYIKIKEGQSATTQNYIASVFKKLFPLVPYSYNSLDLRNAEQYEKEAKWKQIISFSAILTVFISCIGLFGLATLSAEKRLKEIGIRKVLGASVSRIVRTLSVDFLRLVLLSSVIAIPVSWWTMNKWLENYPYRVSVSWWTFALTAITVTVIAICTISFQAFRAAAANPVKSLKTE